MADLSKLHPVFRDRLERMMAATGTSVRSGWRSSEEQAYLYNCYLTGACNNGNPANRPGESNHEAVPWGEPMALAADLQGDLAAAHAVCADYGIHFPIQAVEPWHCQPVEVPYAYYTGVPDFPDEPGTLGPVVSARRRAPGGLRLSSQGADLIAEFEGFVPTIYRDAVGIETIGYGETRPDIIEAHRGREMAQEDAYRLLLERVENDYAPAVRAVGIPLAQSEFDALCSFVYNLGGGVLGGDSTIGAALRRGDYVATADAFGLYVNAAGRRLEGLVNRRAREAALFRSEWGQRQRRPPPLAALFQEDDMPTPFRRRRTDFAGKPTYDAEWVPANAQPLADGLEWRVNVHVQQADPRPGHTAHFTVHGPGIGAGGHAGAAEGGQTYELQPSGYGPVAVVSDSGDELVCSWDRVVEQSG